MTTNNFKPFATGSSANVTAQADWEALSALTTGFSSGKASSAQINKALRQTTVIANVIAQFIANTNNQDVLDDGDTAALLADLITALGANATGRLIGTPKVFTASGTYTPSAGVTAIRVTVTGGGGSGGGSQGTTTSQILSGAGGGSGGTAIKAMSITQGTSYAVVIGSGGAAVSGAVSGNSGGNSSFNAAVIGSGGGGAGASIPNAAGGVGGTATGGDVNFTGGDGSDGQAGTFIFAGNGGASYWGGGGRAGSGSGGTGKSYGSGGGGAYSSSSTALKGGAGQTGIVIIEEFS